MAKTRYVILRSAASDGYNAIGSVTAATAKAAIEEMAKRLAEKPDENGPISGMFVAVPERSWKPMPVTAHQELTLKVG